MPRATRYLQKGFIYHLTHRCHDAQFFLRFAKERDVYRKWLRIGVQRYGVPVLGYSVTRNHTHIVAEVEDRYAVADMMKLAAGVVAQKSHRRKGHEGSVWEHPYHCTRIQDGKHLLNCLRYVDLNMVRARKVKHPCEWRWCGYDELTGARKRYRIIDQERLLHCTGIADMEEFSRFYAASIQERLDQGPSVSEPCWTEAIAIGDHDFVEEAEGMCSYRQSVEKYEIPGPGNDGAWLLQEQAEPYSTVSAEKSTG